jgi:hypothetical protein
MTSNTNKVYPPQSYEEINKTKFCCTFANNTVLVDFDEQNQTANIIATITQPDATTISFKQSFHETNIPCVGLSPKNFFHILQKSAIYMQPLSPNASRHGLDIDGNIGLVDNKKFATMHVKYRDGLAYEFDLELPCEAVIYPPPHHGQTQIQKITELFDEQEKSKQSNPFLVEIALLAIDYNKLSFDGKRGATLILLMILEKLACSHKIKLSRKYCAYDSYDAVKEELARVVALVPIINPSKQTFVVFNSLEPILTELLPQYNYNNRVFPITSLEVLEAFGLFATDGMFSRSNAFEVFAKTMDGDTLISFAPNNTYKAEQIMIQLTNCLKDAIFAQPRK